MGANNTRLDNQLEISNFGQTEIVDFDMNIYFITEEGKAKEFIDHLTSVDRNTIKYKRDSPLTHKIYKGFKFIYLEKQGNELITDLIKWSFTKIKSDAQKNIKSKNKNTFIIYLPKLDDKIITNYIQLFIQQEFQEGEQPFILFFTDDKIDKRKEKEKKIRSLINQASEN